MTRLLVGYPNVYMKKPEKVGPVKIFAVRRQDFSSRLLNVYEFFDESVVHPTQTDVGNFSIFSLLARLRESERNSISHEMFLWVHLTYFRVQC